MVSECQSAKSSSLIFGYAFIILTHVTQKLKILRKKDIKLQIKEIRGSQWISNYWRPIQIT